MSWLITGAGMVGSALYAEAGSLGMQAKLCSRSDLDVSDSSAVLQKFAEAMPSIVFHTAAMTKVNACEQYPQEAWRINAQGTANVAKAASQIQATLVYFSSDYVFKGDAGRPYLETDTPAPINSYGRSKLKGEQHVQELEHHHIVRTSGVFGPRLDGLERNFFRAIMEQLRAGQKEVQVTDAQTCCVTYAPFLARMVCRLFVDKKLPKLVHLTCPGFNTWHRWAQITSRLAGFPEQRIVPVPFTKDEVQRPAYSALGTIYPEIEQFQGKFPAVEGLRSYVGSLRQGTGLRR